MIAFAAGGATEILEDGETGVLFSPQGVADLIEAVERFSTMNFDERTLLRRAGDFDEGRFGTELVEAVTAPSAI